ncbi:MAG: DNA polymerase III subunit beta, partial [Gemmatimonadales bacterium]|nr:DNA polymerase III subunit beta [Gemmatimonadales bacterium]
MKFTITRERLHEGLVAVAASVPTKTTLPVLSNILLEAVADGIRLSGTDLDIAVSTLVPAEVEVQGAVTIPAKKLVEIVRELPSAAIRIGSSGEQRVDLECGRSRFRLLGIPREEFPNFPPVSFENSWTVTSSDLQKLINHVSFAASTEESRPILNGVLWELHQDVMRMVATNGHRLARMDVPVSGGSASATLIVPPKALDQVRRLFGPADEIEIARS